MGGLVGAEQVGDRDRLVTVRAQRSRTEPDAAAVAVVTAMLAEVSALGATLRAAGATWARRQAAWWQLFGHHCLSARPVIASPQRPAVVVVYELHAATVSASGRSTTTPSRKIVPARTTATRWGALTALQRVWADSISLNAMARPAALDPGPLVTLVRNRTVAKVDSIGFEVFRWIQCSAGKSKKVRSTSASPVILATALGHFAPKPSANAVMAASACARSSASRISARALRAEGCADFGSADRTFATLCTLCGYPHRVHKVANVLSALPKSAHPSARKALAEIRDAEDRAHAEAAITAFADGFGAKWPKAVAKITGDAEVLLTFFDFPAEHWIHLKTSNPIESTFATVRLRTKVTKGPGSKAAGLAMAFKLIESAQTRWRAVNAPHLVAVVRAGTIFRDGVVVERPDAETVAA